MAVSFTTTHAESETIHKIALRAVSVYNRDPWALTVEMDVTAAHANGCPLDLERLLAADDLDFAHDVWGIVDHIDRETGALKGGFHPRFARRETRRASPPAGMTPHDGGA